MNIDNLPIIDQEAKKLAASIMQDKFLNEEKILEKIKTFLVSAIATLVDANIRDLEPERQELKSMLADGVFDHDPKLKMNKMYRLGKINDEIKQLNRQIHTVQDYNEYNIMKEWVRQRFGEDAIQEFFALQPEIRVSLYKPRAKQMAKSLVYRAAPKK